MTCVSHPAPLLSWRATGSIVRCCQGLNRAPVRVRELCECDRKAPYCETHMSCRGYTKRHWYDCLGEDATRGGRERGRRTAPCWPHGSCAQKGRWVRAQRPIRAPAARIRMPSGATAEPRGCREWARLATRGRPTGVTSQVQRWGSSCSHVACGVGRMAPGTPERIGPPGLGTQPAPRGRGGRNRWVLRDSNPRHSPCKGDALPAELSTR